MTVFQTDFAFTLIGILNVECAVLPSLSKSAAMPGEAVAIAIELIDLTLAKIVL
jgi:hypothetical protein